jgi:hypothetical protein
VARSLIQRWKYLATRGAEAAVGSNGEVIPLAELRAAQARIKELERLGGLHPLLARPRTRPVGLQNVSDWTKDRTVPVQTHDYPCDYPCVVRRIGRDYPSFPARCMGRP